MRWGRGPVAVPVRHRRRTGPEGEARWWDPQDQALVEQGLLARADLGSGWTPTPMVNNVERLDPYGDDEHSVAVRAARHARTLTALDEGAAWRQRRQGALVVLRAEAYASADHGEHREVWQRHATGCLDAVWRQRWRERDVVPGWIEARWRADGDRPPAPTAEATAAVDWITVEDQTGTTESGVVTEYEHVTVWRGRGVATLTVRHDQVLDLDDLVVRTASALWTRLAPFHGSAA